VLVALIIPYLLSPTVQKATDPPSTPALAEVILSPNNQTVVFPLGQSPTFNVTIVQNGYSGVRFPCSVTLCYSTTDIYGERSIFENWNITGYGAYAIPQPYSTVEEVPTIQVSGSTSFWVVIQDSNGTKITSNAVTVQYSASVHMLKTTKALLILLGVYPCFLLSIIFGFKRSKYLLIYKRKKVDQDFSLAMAGLSVTAIALILALGYHILLVFYQFVLFFSISFATLTLSWYISRLFQSGYGSFASNVLANTGILSLSSGFLEFFYSVLPRNQPIAWLPIAWALGLFILAVWVLSFVDLCKHIKLQDWLVICIVVIGIVIVLVIGLGISFNVIH
jgi:hypothetical protein